MHAKSLIFDEEVLVTGSVNMTHNGYENNKEHMFRITTPSVVADVLQRCSAGDSGRHRQNYRQV
jgi:phosphatidylserine/phosphatidylglycerophosphate/cardiolipin synthase-like enzyme